MGLGLVDFKLCYVVVGAVAVAVAVAAVSVAVEEVLRSCSRLHYPLKIQSFSLLYPSISSLPRFARLVS